LKLWQKIIYGAKGRRSVKLPGSSPWTQYFYDLSDHVVSEFGNGCGPTCWKTGYVYFNGSLVAEYINNTTYFFHKDHLGSTRLLTGIGASQVANGGFEQPGPAGWSSWGGSAGATMTIISDSARAHSGNNYLQLYSPAGGGVSMATASRLAVTPGQQITFGGWAYLESGSAVALGWSIVVNDARNNSIAFIGASPVPGAGWTYTSGTYTVPSNGAYIYLYAQIYQATTATTLRVDDAFLTNGGNATVVDSIDYLPFGEQIAGDTSTTHKFTGKERDSESGLDNFGARYDSSNIGRFMSPDPDNAGANLEAPQSWNAYSYVLNNPLKYVDPTGLDCIYLDEKGTVNEVKPGDCYSEKDNGYYVDSKVGTVTTSDVSISSDNNTMVVSFSSENDLPGKGHLQQFCVGSCPDNSATVSTGLGEPIPTTMSALKGDLMPTSISAQRITQQLGYDFWQLTPVQRSQVQSCLTFTDPEVVSGGGPVPFDSAPGVGGQSAAQVQTDRGQGLTYRNNKPMIPNVKGAKRAGGLSGAAGAAAGIAGAFGCVQNALQ
jgi:RHS repeat-associated protein